MKRYVLKTCMRGLTCLGVGCLTAAALEADTAKTVDDLSGLRPDTAGVETNRFWDTRAHVAFTVRTAGATSSNDFDTAVFTQASGTGSLGLDRGMTLSLR